MLDDIQPDDVLVVQAYGSAYTGCFGEMLVTHVRNRGGAGIVVDERIRDAANVDRIGLPIWAIGATPQYASQGELFPWGYHVPIAAGGVLVLPGDIVIADDDGAVDRAAAVRPAGGGREQHPRGVGGVLAQDARRRRHPAPLLPRWMRSASRSTPRGSRQAAPDEVTPPADPLDAVAHSTPVQNSG